MINQGNTVRLGFFTITLVIAISMVILGASCSEQRNDEQSRQVINEPSPTPPPFENKTLRIGAGESQSVYHNIPSQDFSQVQGRVCFEYEIDLIQEGSRNNLDIDTYVTLPTGETTRHVTVNNLNSPIRGKIYVEQPGRYSVVLDNSSSLFTSKTIASKTRMYTPC